ncbi:MAG: hypothetical protein WEB06_07350 [Actinomycetota bacterium]
MSIKQASRRARPEHRADDSTRIDLAHALPLSSRRWAAWTLLYLVPGACGAVGIAAAVEHGRDTPWVAPLSAPIPGLAQFVQGGWVAGSLFLLVAVFAAVRWIFREDGWLPPVVIGAAVWHAAAGTWWSLFAGAGAALGLILVGRGLATWRREAKRRRFRALRAQTSVREPAIPPPSAAISNRRPAEVTTTLQEQFLRRFLDFGHRPIDDWTAFSEGGEATDGALRYQSVLSAWSLYIAQNRLTPAYREAAATSIRNLAERCRDHRVWNYWRRNNLAGAFRLDPDPFIEENVMYSGYVADIIGMYEALSGDHRFDEPGGYSVTDGKRTFGWNHIDIVDRLAEQHATSPLGAIPCQPGWAFPACQTFSLRAIMLGDRVHGQDHSWAIERFLEAFRFFIGREGAIALSRHNVFGIGYPLSYMLALNGQAGTGAFMAPFARDLAEEHYAKQVKPCTFLDGEGKTRLRLRRIDTLDTSYGRPNPALPYATVLLYAREIGDEETARGLQASLEEMLTPDGAWPAPGTVVSNALTFMALMGTEGGLAAAHRRVASAETTPELESAPYPRVVVPRAVWTGSSLQLVIAPGPDPSAAVEVSFGRLGAGRSYALQGLGEPLVRRADEDGRLHLQVPGDRRLHLELVPR